MRENEQLQFKANYNINKGNQAKMSLSGQKTSNSTTYMWSRTAAISTEICAK